MESLDSKDVADATIIKVNLSKRLTRLIAVFTSLYALLAACSSLMAARCTTRGLVAKNEAVYYQGLSTNEWAFFQSRNIRKELSEIKNKIPDPRFTGEADESFQKARDLESKRDHWNEVGKAYLDVTKTYGAALAFLQVAIILVPLTLIAETTIVFIFGNFLGCVGVGYLFLSFIEYLQIVRALS